MTDLDSRGKSKAPDKVIDDLDPTEDGEASEKAHCASYKTQLCFHRHLQMIFIIIMVI